MSRHRLRILIAGLLAMTIGAAFLWGYLVGYHKLFPFTMVRKSEQVMANFVSMVSRLTEDGQQSTSAEAENYSSIFVNLYAEIVELPTNREGTGGGLSLFGDYVIVLAHDGTLWGGTGPTDMERLAIEPPENHFDEYQKVAQEPPYDKYQHKFITFRYNDIQYYTYGTDRGLIASFTSFNKDENCFNTTLAKLAIASGTENPFEIQAISSDWQVLYQTSPCLPLKKEFRAIEGHMAGGRIAYDGNGAVYLGSGDYHWDGIYAPKALAQLNDNDYGKVVSINVETGKYKIISKGHRNIQGITIDKNGQLWVVEHGFRGGDEINLVSEGGNYGWPEETLGTLYSTLPVPNTRSYGHHDTFQKPVFAWLPSIAVSSLTTIDGFHEAWDGDMLVGSLKDRSLHRIRIRDDQIVFAERIPLDERVRYVLSRPNGTIVVWTDDHQLLFLSIAERSFATEFIDDYISNQDYSADERRSVISTIDQCMECHSFDPTENNTAPSLASIYSAPIAGTDYPNYSSALKSHGGTWIDDSLRLYLESPSEFVPGTMMPNPGLANDFVLEEVVEILKAIRNTPETGGS